LRAQLVSVSAAPASVAEGSTSTLTLARSGPLTGNVTVAFSLASADGAVYGSDYVLEAGTAAVSVAAGGGSGTITLPANVASSTVTLRARGDYAADGTQRVVLALVAQTSDVWAVDPFASTGGANATVSITDVALAVGGGLGLGGGGWGLGAWGVGYRVPGVEGVRACGWGWARESSRAAPLPPDPVASGCWLPPSRPCVRPPLQKLVASVSRVGPELVTEGSSLSFNFSLDAPAAAPLSVRFALDTAAGSLASSVACGTDFQAAGVTFSPAGSGSFACSNGTVSFAAGAQAVSMTLALPGDSNVKGLLQLKVVVASDAAYTVSAAAASATGYVTDVPVRASAVSGGRG
jgi:hypothetical protein